VHQGRPVPRPNALISSNYTGFKVVWTSSIMQPYSSGVPIYLDDGTVSAQSTICSGTLAKR
jgi:hypothetical protein